MATAWYDNPANVTQYNDIFREILLPPVRDQINREVFLVNTLTRQTVPVGPGKQWEIPLNIGRNEGVGAVKENKTLPAPGRQSFDRAWLKPAHVYGRMLITGVVKDLTQGNVGAVASALDQETKGLAINMKQEMCRMLYGDGRGILALVNDTTGYSITNGGSTTVTIDSTWGRTEADHDNKAFLIRTGMTVAFCNPTTGAVNATGEVTATTNTTITVTGIKAGSVSDDDVICRVNDNTTSVSNDDAAYTYDPDGSPIEPWGLFAITDDGNIPTTASTFLGIDANTNSWWQAKHDGSSSSGTLKDIDVQEWLDEITVNSQETPDLLVTTYKVRRQYANTLTSLKRFVNTTTLEGGWTAIEVNGRPMVPDFMCPEACLFFLNTKELALWQIADLQWIDDDGAILHRSESVDRFQATMKWRMNLGTYKRQAHGLLYDVA